MKYYHSTNIDTNDIQVVYQHNPHMKVCIDILKKMTKYCSVFSEDEFNTKCSDYYDYFNSDLPYEDYVTANKSLYQATNTILKNCGTPLFDMSNVILTKLDDDADIYTIDEFVQCVKDYFFINDDGFGYFIIDDKESNIYFSFAFNDDIRKHIPKQATGISWYNR